MRYINLPFAYFLTYLLMLSTLPSHMACLHSYWASRLRYFAFCC